VIERLLDQDEQIHVVSAARLNEQVRLRVADEAHFLVKTCDEGLRVRVEAGMLSGARTAVFVQRRAR
jgi:hypothetical protein